MIISKEDYLDDIVGFIVSGASTEELQAFRDRLGKEPLSNFRLMLIGKFMVDKVKKSLVKRVELLKIQEEMNAAAREAAGNSMDLVQKAHDAGFTRVTDYLDRAD